jgi:hypothetical protein
LCRWETTEGTACIPESTPGAARVASWSREYQSPSAFPKRVGRGIGRRYPSLEGYGARARKVGVGGRVSAVLCGASEPRVEEPAASRHPRCGCESDHRAHCEGCQRVGRPRPPNQAQTTLGKPRRLVLASCIRSAGRKTDRSHPSNPPTREPATVDPSTSVPPTEIKTGRWVLAETRRPPYLGV